MAKYNNAAAIKRADRQVFLDMVCSFRDQMMARFDKCAREGWCGWDGASAGDIKKFKTNLKERLLDNAKRGDWIDVANLAAMLWNLED